MSIRRRTTAALLLTGAMLVACEDGERAGTDREQAPIDTMPQGPVLDPAMASHLPPGATFEQAQAGHRLFTVCTVCHGPAAEGTQLGPSFVDGEWIGVEPEAGQIAELIRTGVPRPAEYPVPMPPHGGGDFDEEELRALAVYVLTVANRGVAQ
jgi:mono/diheme cytochrome c family protein